MRNQLDRLKARLVGHGYKVDKRGAYVKDSYGQHILMNENANPDRMYRLLMRKARFVNLAIIEECKRTRERYY